MDWFGSWMLLAVLILGIGAMVVYDFRLSFLNREETRWVVSGVLGSIIAVMVSPSPLIAVFVLTLALSIPVSLWRFTRPSRVALSSPPMASATLTLIAVWTVSLGLVVSAMRTTGILPLLLAVLAGCTYNNVVAALQVFRGVEAIVWNDPAYGEVGSTVRQPTAWLANIWKPAAINAMCLPIVALLILQGKWWSGPLAILSGLMVWQIVKAGGYTAIASAALGTVAGLLAGSHLLTAVLVAPLAVVSYPAARRKIMDDPRWEAWVKGKDLLQKSRWFGCFSNYTAFRQRYC